MILELRQAVEGSGAAYLTDVLTEKSVTLMTASKEPFFMYYATYAVHLPINPITELVPKYLKRESKLGQTNAKYASMVENLDKNIGVLIKGLKDAGKFENTFIIFTSDNSRDEKFKDISLDLKQQVNNGTIQMESELYNHIRPKGILSKDIRPYNQLKENGIEYLEIRSIDLNPYSTIGISMEDIEFLELVSLYCALSDAPIINDVDSLCIKENIRRSSESGQNCNFITSLDGEKAEACES